ncbi:hypothetical protein Tco_0394944, partial [Tanacetum coccineum]
QDVKMRIVTAFIRGEVAASSAKMVRPSQWVKGNVYAAWSGRPEKLETGVVQEKHKET